MTVQPPVTSHETVHDYRLLEQFQQKESATAVHQQYPTRWAYVLALLLAALAFLLSVTAIVHAYLNRPVPLVPGSFQNATVAVDSAGRIISVAQGAPPATITVAPVGGQPVQSGERPRFPWSPRTPDAGEAKVAPESRGDATSKSEGSAEGSNPVKIVEDFVKFQSVRFKSGAIETGWRYADSNATDPAHQWCYYKDLIEKRKGFQPMLDLGEEADLDAIRAMGLTRDEYIEAQGKCQWFNGVKPIAKIPPGKTY